MYSDQHQAFVYVVPRLKELPTETGKEKVQRDVSDFVEVTGQVTGEQGCLCVLGGLRDAVSQAAL